LESPTLPVEQANAAVVFPSLQLNKEAIEGVCEFGTQDSAFGGEFFRAGLNKKNK
jgi:hypothetical protein